MSYITHIYIAANPVCNYGITMVTRNKDGMLVGKHKNFAYETDKNHWLEACNKAFQLLKPSKDQTVVIHIGQKALSASDQAALSLALHRKAANVYFNHKQEGLDKIFDEHTKRLARSANTIKFKPLNSMLAKNSFRLTEF